MKKLLLSLALFLGIGSCALAEEFTDVLTADVIGASTSGYGNCSYTSTTSGVVYSGQMMQDDSGNMQMRSKQSNSGLVVTANPNGYIIKSINVTVGSGSNTSYIVAKNEAYTAPTDLYGSNKGDELARNSASYGYELAMGGTEYTYFGFRSSSGAIYISKIEVVWKSGAEEGQTEAPVLTIVSDSEDASTDPYYFINEALVEVDNAGENVYHYTLDGTEPALEIGGGTMLYNAAEGLSITSSCTLNIAQIANGVVGVITTVTFEQKVAKDYTALPASISLYERQTENLLGEEAHPANMTFTSANDGIATVDSNGVVTAVAEGETTISVTWTADENFTAGEATITVNINPLPDNAKITVDLTKQNLEKYGKGEVRTWVGVEGIFTFATSATSTGSSYPAWNSSGLRIYNSNGNVVTVNAPEGYFFVSAEYVLANTANHISINGVDCCETNNTYTFTNQDTSFTMESVKHDGATNKNSDVKEMTFIINKIPEAPDYTTWNFYVVGDFNGWQDAGVKFNEAGYAVYENVAIGTSEFSLGAWDGETDYSYSTGTSVAVGESIVLEEGFNENNMTIEGAAEGDLFNVAFDVTTRTMVITKVEPFYFECQIYNVTFDKVVEGTTLGTQEDKVESISYKFINYSEDVTIWYRLNLASSDPGMGDEPGIMAIDKEGFTAYNGEEITVPVNSNGTLEYFAENAAGVQSQLVTLFLSQDVSGVDDIEIDGNNNVEYFNLQGVKVVNPSEGLYIVRRGNTVTKELVR